MTTPTHSHKAWTDKGGHVSWVPLLSISIGNQKPWPIRDMKLRDQSLCMSQ